MGFLDAIKTGQYQLDPGSGSNVTINVGNGNSNITVNADHVDITAGTGNQNVVVLGNDVDVALDQNAAEDWDFTEDVDNVAVIAERNDKEGVSIDTGDGNDSVLAVADNLKVEMGDGQHNIAFWGNDVSVNVGDGNNEIYTMDRAFQNGTVTTGTNINGVNVGVAAADAIESYAVQEKVIVQPWKEVSRTGDDKTAVLNKIKTQYNLDAVNMKKLTELYDSGELFKTFNNTDVPQYAIVKSVKTGKYVIGKVDSGSAVGGYIHMRGLDAKGAFTECIATKASGKNSYKESETINKEQKYRIDDVYWGPENLDIKTGSGSTSDINVTSHGQVNVTTGDFKQNDIEVNKDGYRDQGEVKVERDSSQTSTTRTVNIATAKENTYTSPLVIDFNRDGKVTASDGKGIDVDGNGVADGAATGGDKMLAMSDGNGNSSIDGTEVFGDQTVSPFTGEKLEAKNGFEALRMVAEEAERYLGASCITDGVVDLAALKVALSEIGVNLGLLSDENNTELEDLGHVASINVAEYAEVDATGNVQHRQLGSYTDTEGEEYGVNDVWFKNR